MWRLEKLTELQMQGNICPGTYSDSPAVNTCGQDAAHSLSRENLLDGYLKVFLTLVRDNKQISVEVKGGNCFSSNLD